MDFLEIKGLKKSFGQGESHIDVLKGIDMTINQGEFCVLLGPSGSGKSTLLNIIGGIDSLDEGELIINKHRLKTMKEKELSQYRRDHLGYIFQMYNLIPNLTVRENIEVGAYLSKKPLDIDDLLHTLGLYEHQNKLPNQLSGGQQQRVAIARAVVTNARLLLADEPTGNLDSTNGVEVMELLSTLNKQVTTIIIVTHSQRDAAYAHRIIRLLDGKIIAENRNRPMESDSKIEIL